MDHIVQLGEVAIMQAVAAGEFPDTFDRVQFRAIGRQIVQNEVSGVLRALVLVKKGVMILGIVGDDHNAPAAANTGPPEDSQEGKEGEGIELARFPGEKESSVP